MRQRQPAHGHPGSCDRVGLSGAASAPLRWADSGLRLQRAGDARGASARACVLSVCAVRSWREA
eukprot:6140434-Prymnesium_polylepis.1